MVLDDGLTGWDEYRAAAADVALDLAALGLHRRMWALADIASFVALLRRSHADTTDTRKAVAALRTYLGGQARGPIPVVPVAPGPTTREPPGGRLPSFARGMERVATRRPRGRRAPLRRGGRRGR